MLRILPLIALFGTPSVAFAATLCQTGYAPVCALKNDGARADFSNACVARQADAKVLHAGNCDAPGKEPAMCNMLFEPVCASDPATGSETTYPNLCHAEKANAHVLHDGDCAVGNAGKH